MAEAELELRREAEKMFKDLGMTELPKDTLDFFQRNLENGGGDSDDWKRSLMGPSSNRPRRTSSDGNALVHLKKKYATGLNPDYHSKRNAAIAAVTTHKTAASDTENSKEKLRTRRLSPTGGFKGRFGYSGPVSSRPKGTESDKQPAESQEPAADEVVIGNTASLSTTDPSTTIREVSMLKRRTLKPKTASSPASGDTSVDPKQPLRLAHTTSAGSVLKQPSSALSRGRQGSTKASEPNASTVNGVYPSVPTGSNQAPLSNTQAPATTNMRSYKHPVATNMNTRIPSSSSNIMSGIDSIKLSSVNMRSLTKAPERKTSTERKVSTESKISTERRYSSEKRMSDTEKPSGIPIPAQVPKSTPPSKVVDESGDGNNTQVVFSRKSSFKVLNVSSSSHRILHTVQDGGAPKRQNSINRGVRPVSILSGSSSQPSNNMTRPLHLARQVSEGSKLDRRAYQPLSPPGTTGQDSSGSRGSLATYPGNMEEGKAIVSQRQGAKALSQGKKKEGMYDRLAENPTAAKEEPVYDTISDGHQVLTSPDSAAKDAVGAGSGDVPPKPANVWWVGDESMVGESGEPKPVDSKKAFGGPHVSKTSGEVPSFDRSRIGASNRVTQSLRLPSAGRSISNPRESERHLAKSPEGSRLEKPTSQSSISRYSTDSGAIYSMVNKPGGPPTPVKPKEKENVTVTGRSSESRGSSSKVNQPSTVHRALSSSLSDTSSESWQPKDFSTSESEVDARSPIPQVSEVLSDEEVKEASLKRGEKETLNPEKRQALLAMNWSHQSLDMNMQEVATSTVAALSTLVEALTTPVHDSADKKFEFDIDR
jgi:hypothetical protein